MPKRTRAEINLEAIHSVFNSIFSASSAVDFSTDPNKYLNALKTRVLDELSKGKEKTTAAKDFTLFEAIETFGLKFEEYPTKFIRKHHWDIENEVGMEEFPTTPCIESLLDNYAKNFDRTSESMCKTAVNFMLNECLTVMKGLNEIKTADDARPKTLSPLHDIKIFGEVSFTHTVISRTTKPPSPNIVVVGRVDHGIGRVLKSRAVNATEQRKRRFYSLLLLVEAKFHNSVDQAIPQLIVYLACLRQSRLQRNRMDASVYGLASDGYVFIFVKILHDGTVMRSRRFDILNDEMKKVLGYLKYVLEITASRSPKSSPERNEGDRHEVDESDPLFALDNNKFMSLPGEDEEDEEDER